MILFMLLSWVHFIRTKEPSILILQNIRENFTFDFPSKYPNSSYVIDSIEPMNEFSKPYQLPNVTFPNPVNLLTSLNVAQMCPIQSWGPTLVPITLILSPQYLNVFIYTKESETLIVQEKSVSYPFIYITGYRDIKCTHITNDPFQIQNIYIDCYTDKYFININATLPKVDFKRLDIEFKYEIYEFKDKDFSNYWQSCLKKDIEFLLVGNSTAQLFTCKIAYQKDDLQYQESLIGISIGSTLKGNVRTYDLEIYNRSDFTNCSKMKDSSEELFILQDFVVHPWDQVKSYVKPKGIWDFALLLVNRSGICKCSIYSKLHCEFLELQDSNYTRIKSLRAIDNQLFFYVSSIQYVIRIKIFESQKIDKDITDLYFATRQKDYRANGLFPYLNFLIVQMSKKNQTSNHYENKFIKNCILDIITPAEPISTYKIFEIRKGQDTFYKPSHTFNSPSNIPVIPLFNLYKFGTYFAKWDSLQKSFQIFIMNSKEGLINYNFTIPSFTYLLFRINVTNTYTSDDDYDEDYVLHIQESIDIGIVPFNDSQLAILTKEPQDIEKFDTQQFSFCLDERLVGPQKQFLEIDWISQQIDSSIEFMSSIPINDIPQRILRVFSVKLTDISTFPYLVIKASTIIDESDNSQTISEFRFNYSSHHKTFNYFKDAQSHKYLKMKDINYYKVGVQTEIIANLNETELYLCYLNEMDKNCTVMKGDILKNTKLLHVQQIENDCIANIMIVIPFDRKSVIWYQYDCDAIQARSFIDTKLIGQINSVNIPELQKSFIIDYHFDFVDNFVSALLLSDGTIIILTNFQQYDVQGFGLEVSAKITNTVCKPSNYSSISILNSNDIKLLYVCNDNDNSRISEYQLSNPYKFRFIREYSLYGYKFIDSQSNFFTDGNILYLAAYDRNSKSLVYLAYNPEEFSPNVLQQSIFIRKMDDPLMLQLRPFECLPVSSNNIDTYNIFSIAFFKTGDKATLNLIQDQPSYYGSANNVSGSLTKMIMVYQQNTQNILYMSYQIQFDFSESEISMLKNETSIKMNDTFISTTNDYFANLNFKIDTSKMEINGSVQDYNLKMDVDSYFTYKDDFLQLKNRLAKHQIVLQYGQLLDITHLNQQCSIYPNECNLIFAITQNNLIIIEKEYYDEQQYKQQKLYMRIYKSYNLRDIFGEFNTTNKCQLSLNSAQQLLIYCYIYYPYEQNGESNYVYFDYEYNKLTSEINVTYNRFNTNLGKRVKLDSIQPVVLGEETFQFLKYNYKSTPQQFEIVVGVFSNSEFQRIVILESSSLDFRLIGKIEYDVSPINNTDFCVMVFSEKNSVVVKIYNYKNNFTINKAYDFPQNILNSVIFNSPHTQFIKFLKITEALSENEVIVVLGTEDNYYQIKFWLNSTSSTLELIYKFHKYFQCKNAVWEEPTIIDQNADLFAVACIGATKVSNIFFDVQEFIQESDLVYLQIYSKQYIQSGKREGWPKRVIEFISTKDHKQFKISYFRNNNQDFLLVENGTYLLENYQLKDRLIFEVYVSQKQNSIQKGKSIDGSVVFLNDYNSKNITLKVEYETTQLRYQQVWLVTMIVILTFLFLIIALSVLYTLFAPKNIKFRLSEKILSDSLQKFSSPKKTQKQQEFAILDEAIKEVLGVTHKNTRTHRNDRRKASLDSIKMDSRIKVHDAKYNDQSSESDD